eukprot:2293974-Pleurochrysis_carterae.AAC.1
MQIGATNGACKGAGELVQARRCIVGLKGCARREDEQQAQAGSVSREKDFQVGYPVYNGWGKMKAGFADKRDERKGLHTCA